MEIVCPSLLFFFFAVAALAVAAFAQSLIVAAQTFSSKAVRSGYWESGWPHDPFTS